MFRYALIALAVAVLAGCNSGPSKTAENTVGGSDVVFSAQAPMKKATTSLTLDWGSKGRAGLFAIADVISYGGPKPAITAPAGWQLIRDDSTITTRQSLYGHAIAADDPGSATWTFSAPVDAQGAIMLLDNVATPWPIDMTSHNTGNGGLLTAKPVSTTSDGDLILAFNATDFGNVGLNPTLPPDVNVVLNHEATVSEYWILSNYQIQPGDTAPEDSSAPQLFQWVATQVAIKRGAATSPTPSS
jgi:hypothetical protein